MRILILILTTLAIAASAASADVCVEQPPGEIVCVPESPVGPGAVHAVWLPIVNR